jgi:hypothetical protein
MAEWYLKQAGWLAGLVGFIILDSKSAPSQMTLHDSNALRR